MHTDTDIVELAEQLCAQITNLRVFFLAISTLQ